MSTNRYLSEKTIEKVRQRANYLCEYCHASEKWQYVKFTVDHIIPLNKAGSNLINNLALVCFHCNRRKSNKISAIDEQSRQEVLLFNPRNNLWQEHFISSTDKTLIICLTVIGRATIKTLNMNRSRIIDIPIADAEVGRHLPPGDPIQS
ncbi:HNH endonuclease signature motif containing protein [Okeania sp.]|uniref:HNH endonuclease n=1 Tax=Okeania sp. TaxID=3100323 RepID=UPI002B4AD431|nr:HNH endonuclease signature motif containing protein [Okeania sp.]MEB3340943.1 HNH endonuclease signature motif containing protein [Okeania sp.]